MKLKAKSSAGALRYPSLGDPKPRVNQCVGLIRADNKHDVGFWTDDCKAWWVLSADTRKNAKEAKLI